MQAAADERIDTLEKKIDDGFAEMRREFKEVHTEIQGEFKEVRAEMKGEFRAVRAETQEMGRELRSEIISARDAAREDSRTLLSVTVGMWATTALGVVGILLSHL